MVRASSVLWGLAGGGLVHRAAAEPIEPVPLVAAFGASETFGEPEQAFLSTIDADEGERQFGICSLRWSTVQLGASTGLEMDFNCTGRRWIALGVGEQLEGAEVLLAVPLQSVRAVRLGSELNEIALESFDEVPLGGSVTYAATFSSSNGEAHSHLTFATSSIGDTQLFRRPESPSSTTDPTTPSPTTAPTTPSPTEVPTTSSPTTAPTTSPTTPQSIKPLPFIVLIGRSRKFDFPGDIYFTELDTTVGSRKLGGCLLEWEAPQIEISEVLHITLECSVDAWIGCGVGAELEGAEMVLAVPRRRVTAVRLGNLFGRNNILIELEKISIGSASTPVANFTTLNGVPKARLEFAASSIGNTKLLDMSQSTESPTAMTSVATEAEDLPFIMAVGRSETFGEPETVFKLALSSEKGKEEFEGGCVIDWAKSQLGSSPGLMVSFECPGLRWLACGFGEQLEGARVVLAIPARPVEAFRLGSELSEDALNEYEKVTMGSASTSSASFRTSNEESSSRLEFLVEIFDDTPFLGIADDNARGNGGLIAAGVGSFFCASVIVGFVTRKRQSQSNSGLPVALAFEAEQDQDLNDL